MINKINKSLSYFILMLLVSLSGCSGSLPSEPEEVVNEYVNALITNDVNKVIQLSSDDNANSPYRYSIDQKIQRCLRFNMDLFMLAEVEKIQNSMNEEQNTLSSAAHLILQKAIRGKKKEEIKNTYPAFRQKMKEAITDKIEGDYPNEKAELVMMNMDFAAGHLIGVNKRRMGAKRTFYMEKLANDIYFKDKNDNELNKIKADCENSILAIKGLENSTFKVLKIWDKSEFKIASVEVTNKDKRIKVKKVILSKLNDGWRIHNSDF